MKNTNFSDKLDGVILKGVGGLYSVSTQQGVFQCKARGIFRNKRITPLVGDCVVIKVIDENQLLGNIEEIKDRSSELKRPRVANVEQAAIVVAVRSPAINYGLLDRLITLIENEGLGIIICINKIDLDTENIACELAELYGKIGYGVYPVSTVSGQGVAKLSRVLGTDGCVTVFSGPSGVGKSSVINAVMSAEHMEIGGLSERIDRGKHTTRHTQLLQHEEGFIVDSPGFTSLYMENVDIKKLPYLFREFQPYFDRCRFADCAHIKEAECGVKEQLGSGINERRYETYKNIYFELQNQRF